MVTASLAARHRAGELGFTLVELLIATFVGMIVLGSGVTLVSQVQRGYTRQLDHATMREEARFAVDWIARELKSAGSNPYGISVSDCPVAGTSFSGLQLDPNQNGSHDDVRINSDAGTPNGLLGGAAGNCHEADEDVTIAFDLATKTITRQDHNVDQAPIPMTDAVITALDFTYLDLDRFETTDPAAVAFVQVGVTARGRAMNAQSGTFDTVTQLTEVHLRSR